MRAVTARALHDKHVHGTYGMRCAEFDELCARADGRCEICGAENHTLRAVLYIDHDHWAGQKAVRGLLCARCNRMLITVENGQREPSTREVAYLLNPWYLRASTERPVLLSRDQCAMRHAIDQKLSRYFRHSKSLHRTQQLEVLVAEALVSYMPTWKLRRLLGPWVEDIEKATRGHYADTSDA